MMKAMAPRTAVISVPAIPRRDAAPGKAEAFGEPPVLLLLPVGAGTPVMKVPLPVGEGTPVMEEALPVGVLRADVEPDLASSR
jgi:hypothetical protein